MISQTDGMLPTGTQLDRSSFITQLKSWYKEHQRPLPWRKEPSLYKTVVSEFMLQQTQVDTVLPYFDRWLEHFPDFSAIAAVSAETVVKHWEGLGYYTRARNLHKLAQILAAQATPPTTVSDWLTFPGVGPYTAAAITSIAFATPIPAVDGNVIRTLTRLTADQTAFKDSAQAHKQLTPLARHLLDTQDPGNHNQAMMELGATVCLRHNPLCSICPVQTHCQAHQMGTPESFPVLAKKRIHRQTTTRAWVIHRKALLLYQHPPTAKRLANLFELPSCQQLEVVPQARHLLVTKKRSISNQTISEPIYRIAVTPQLEKTAIANPNLHWIPLNQLDTVTLSGPHRKWTTLFK